MNTTERYIYISIIIILVGLLVGGGLYFGITRSYDNPEIKNNNIDKNNEKDNNSEGDKNIKEDDKITLSEKELNEYLSYVPYNNYIEENKSANAYLKDLKLNDIEEKDLVSYVLAMPSMLVINEGMEVINDEEYFYNSKISSNTVINMLKKAYDKSNIVFKEGLNKHYYVHDAWCFDYYQNYFYGGACGGGGEAAKIDYIDSYEASLNDLIIYEYAALYYQEYTPPILEDYRTGKEIKLNNSSNKEVAETYLKEHKMEFSKYKHTFKKGNKGYYWYSTKLV